MKINDLKDFLDLKAGQYENTEFILTDPIQIPHRFSKKEDIEIAAFLTATIAWGNRISILKSGSLMMELMDHSPFDFVMNHHKSNLSKFEVFVHRTFNSVDLSYFITALKNIYLNHNGLENLFSLPNDSLQNSIHHFKSVFFELDHLKRTEKHVSDPVNGSAAKRINMFLRWMVRSDKQGVDFGLWKSIETSALSLPLDVHTGNMARKLGLLKRKQNDSKTLSEIDIVLRTFDPNDPVKYDFALFGLGAFEKF